MTAVVERLPVGARPGFPDAVERGSFIFLSGLAATLSPPSSGAGNWIGLVEEPWRSQATALYDRLEELCLSAGGLESVLRLHLYQRDKRFFPVLEDVRVEKEGTAPAPSSGIGIATIHSSSAALYEADGIALSPGGRERYGARVTVASGGAGASASYYSQVSRAGPYVFLAGFIPIDPESHRLVAGFEDVDAAGRFLQRGRSHPDARTGPIAAQSWAVYGRILATLEQLGLTRDDVVCSTAFLSHAADTADFLRVHAHVFGDAGPAVQLVCVDEVGHRGTIVEIEVTAVAGGARRSRLFRRSEVPSVVSAGELAFVSDQLPQTSTGAVPGRLADLEDEVARALLRPLIEACGAAHEAAVTQTWLALANLRHALEAAAVPPDSIAHVWLRVCRPNSLQWVEPLLTAAQPEIRCALTVTEVHSIAQAASAQVAVSAICGGLGG